MSNVDRAEFHNPCSPIERKVRDAINTMLNIADDQRRHIAHLQLHNILTNLEAAAKGGHQNIIAIERNNLRDFIERYA